ncbi:hypothetical protein HKX48_001669 [Thoreauomyces humboldtii]|nr:hypothetical protein HKX48_001669 [Thoreauomyces humboldtii]
MKRRIADIHTVIAAIPSVQSATARSVGGSEDGQSHREVAVQTLPLPFAPNTKTQYLLSEVRQWGPAAQTLPAKGIGNYMARGFQQPQQQQQLQSGQPSMGYLGKETVSLQGPPLRS